MNTLVLTDVDFYPVIQPIREILDANLWLASAIVVAVGNIYCIFLGVKISKADEQNYREGEEGSDRSRHRLRVDLRSDLGGLGQVTDVEDKKRKGGEAMLLNDLMEGRKDMFFTFLYTCFRFWRATTGIIRISD